MFFYFLFTHYTYTLYQQPGTQEDTIMTGLNVPGTSFQAYATLPLRVLLAGMLFSMSYSKRVDSWRSMTAKTWPALAHAIVGTNHSAGCALCGPTNQPPGTATTLNRNMET